MGCGSENLPMMFIIIFMLISLKSTHVLTVDASLDAAKDIRVYGLQQLHSMVESGDSTQNQIEKVSGADENEQKEALIVQKFRALLGLRSFKTRSPSRDIEYVSPSPSPSLSIEPQAPAPVLPLHAHSHSPPPRTRPMPTHHKSQKESTHKGRARRILVPALVSTGAVFAVCVLGLICVCCKFKKNRMKSMKTMSLYSKKGRTRGKSKYLNSQNSSSKVSLNPGLDLFYLDSLENMDLEQQQPTPCFKQTAVTVNPSSNDSTPSHRLHEREEPDQESRKSESDNASSSCTREIMSVHGDADSVKYESDGGNSSSAGKIITIECNSSDDESFHSFNDSHSSNIRLSNASAGSLTDTSEICNHIVPRKSPSPLSSPTNLALPQATPNHMSTSASNLQTHPLQSPYNHKEDNLTVTCSPDCQKKFTPPPAPPPPPPPPPMSPSMRIFPSHSSCCSIRIAPKASCSFTLPKLSPPRNSDSSTGSSQTPLRELPSSPQKHSKPSQTPPGIPPPPCPPPFLKGSTNSFKGPPPPPSQLPQYTPLGKDGAPLPKLKPLHWDKVRAAPDRSMVWDKLKSSSFELDEEMIESLFGYNIQSSMKNDEAKSKSPSPSKHVLEPKRLQNITILSKALNVTSEQVSDALMKGEGLSLQQLEALVRMVPTKEEEAKLSGYKDVDNLGSAEKFVKAILGIPFAFQRVEAMLYRETFEDEVVHLRNSFSMLEEACKELRSSRLFLKLLEAVLKTGNRMNVGTIRGGARAFKLDALLKLADVKGTDGKTTLLHFVVQEIIRAEGIRVSDSIMGKITQRNKSKTVEEKEEDYRRMGLDLVSGLTTELYNVKKTATIDIDVLASSVSNLSEGMATLQHLVHKDLCDEKSGNFVHSMKSFIIYAEKKLKELQEDEDRVLLNVREITEYFHGDVSKEEANPLRIFVIVRDFLGMLDHVCKELRSLKAPSSPIPLAPFR